MADIYDRLGVRKIISCCGTLTAYGGALMAPEVLEAMKEASQHHVLITELQEKTGQRIAELIGVEAAFITTGASGGLVLATAACIAGSDPAKMYQLPDTTGLKNEVIVCKCQLDDYAHGAIPPVGAKFVEIGSPTHGTHPWQMEGAINENTAFCFYAPAHNDHAALPFETFGDIAKAHGLPIVMDLAAEVPPVSNLRKYSDLGADLVVFSGGKGLRGPQSAGLIVGRKDLIKACAANSSPNLFIGRPLKVGKEELVGMVVALELYLDDISKREHEIWEGMVAHIVDALKDIPHIRAYRHFPYRLTRDVPIVAVELEEALGLTLEEVMEKLNHGEPPIYVPAISIVAALRERGVYGPSGYPGGPMYPGGPVYALHERGLSGFVINPHTMKQGEEIVVARRLREIFTGQG